MKTLNFNQPTKSNISYILTFITLTLWSFTLSADNQTFELSGHATDNNASLADVKITVFEESIFMTQSSTTSNGKFIFSLELNKNFKIRLEKEGYASEDILVNTNLPENFSTQKFSHEISLKMFSLTKETLPFTFNEPVAKIAFHKVIKGFTSDIYYKKTFAAVVEEKESSVHDRLGNSAISQEFKYELTLRRHQPKKQEVIKEEAIALPSITIQKIETIEKEIVAIVIPRKEEIILTKITVAKEESKETNKKMLTESIVERTRKINKTTVYLNEKNVEFTEVIYNNGGVHYFKNGASISGETYKREIKSSNQYDL